MHVWSQVHRELDKTTPRISSVTVSKPYFFPGRNSGPKYRAVHMTQTGQDSGIELITAIFVMTDNQKWEPAELWLSGTYPVDSWEVGFKLVNLDTPDTYRLSPRPTALLTDSQWILLSPQQRLKEVWKCIARGSYSDPYEQAGDVSYWASMGSLVEYRYGRNGLL